MMKSIFPLTAIAVIAALGAALTNAAKEIPDGGATADGPCCQSRTVAVSKPTNPGANRGACCQQQQTAASVSTTKTCNGGSCQNQKQASVACEWRTSEKSTVAGKAKTDATSLVSVNSKSKSCNQEQCLNEQAANSNSSSQESCNGKCQTQSGPQTRKRLGQNGAPCQGICPNDAAEETTLVSTDNRQNCGKCARTGATTAVAAGKTNEQAMQPTMKQATCPLCSADTCPKECDACKDKTNEDSADIVGAGSSNKAAEGQQHDHANDPRHDQDHNDFFFLIEHRDSIQRTVKNLPNGIETLTESDQPEVASKIQVHVESMYDRLENHQPIRMRDPLFRAIFANADKIEMEVEHTQNGVRVRETSTDAYVASLLQEHAKVVTKFIENGYQELPKNHPAPTR